MREHTGKTENNTTNQKNENCGKKKIHDKSENRNDKFKKTANSEKTANQKCTSAKQETKTANRKKWQMRKTPSN